jgi:hypothetical protein
MQAKYVGWTLFFLSLAVFCIYHVWSFSRFENELFQAFVR